MKILVTGAKGFIGQNLIAELKNRNYADIYEYDLDTKQELIDIYAQQCDFVFHLAGINRPQNPEEYMQGNYGFTSKVLGLLKRYNNKAPVLITSSTQAELDNPYGRSKKAGEELMISYERETGTRVYVYRLPNVFGKWCRPNYNSAVATFCNNIAKGLPIQVNDPNVILNLVYIDDVIKEFIDVLERKKNINSGYCSVKSVYTKKLGKIAELIYSFKESRDTKDIPNMSDDFTRNLYSTYLSYLPPNECSYRLKMNIDNRGSFTEFIKTADRGQVSVNISKPGITKGNHWHHTKNEKFLVVSGIGIIKLRKVNSDQIFEYQVSGDKLEVIDILPGYTHNITNIGSTELVTIMWANEVFNPAKPDTIFLEV